MSNRIKFDESSQLGRNLKRGLDMLLEAKELLTNVLAAEVQMISNGGASVTDFAEMAVAGGFDTSVGGHATANHAAQASYNELASVLAKLNTDGSVTNVDAGIKQIAAKHGVV